MFVQLCRFLSGFVKIKIFGDFPERFINICAFNGIKLWNIRNKGDFIYANVSTKDFKKIHKVKKSHQMHISIISKRGIYFLIKPYLMRKGIAVGLILFFAVNIILSRFIWNIEIVGNKIVSKEKIISYCKELGVGEGVYSKSIDTNNARLKLLMNHPELSWASFVIEGSHLTVNLLETKTAEVKETAPANLVASKDGVIDKITISKGKAVVQKNQAVLKGDLLGTGVLEYGNGTTHFVRCSGEVTAKTEKSITCTAPFTIRKTVLTGREEKRRVLNVFGLKIPLSFVPVNFKHKRSTDTNRLTNGSSYSPIYMNEITYKEVETVTTRLNREEAVLYVKEKLKKEEIKQLQSAEILSYNDEINFDNSNVTITRKYSCLENIAVQEKIKINTAN